MSEADTTNSSLAHFRLAAGDTNKVYLKLVSVVAVVVAVVLSLSVTR